MIDEFESFKLKKVKLSVTALIILANIFFSAFVHAAEDTALAEKLKEELNFNQQRRKGFKKQTEDQKIFNLEREKGLALFLEEQEKFDQARDRGISEYKKTKQKPMDESSPEFFADLKEKKMREVVLENARKLHVKTRDQIVSQYDASAHQSEMTELELYNQRPRYDLRKRYKNKWTQQGQKSTGSTSSSFGGGAPVPENPMDFPAPVDYAPQPIENFEEIPPPPPIPYDPTGGQGYPTYDSGYGDAAIPPPPPPPPDGGWDF